jgi:hypothetical protein
MPDVDRQQLRKWAVTGAEQRLLEIAIEAEAIHRAFPELRQQTAAGAPGRARTGSARKRAGMSAANRKAVSERMKKYWAGRRGAAAAGASKRASRGRRRMSAAARKRISDAQKKRWARQKAAGKRR